MLKAHHFGPGKISLKAQNITHFRAAPTIYRLIVIPDTADIFMPPRQQPQPQILCHICILILIHQNIAEPSLVLRQNIRVGLKDCHHMQQQIPKIDCVKIFQALLVLGIKLNPK